MADSLADELARLGAALHRQPLDFLSETPEVEGLAAETVVALPAGGFGYRMRDVAQEAGGVTQKSLLPLPNGETLIGRLVRQYAAAGFRRFVALVNHEGAAVEEHLAGGAPWGVEVRCSFDPDPRGSGRTGALLHAVAAGILPADRTLIVHNADCQVIRYAGCFPRDLLRAHRAGLERRGVLATAAAVDGARLSYTGMAIAAGIVTGVEMYPFIPVPSHTGITALTPEALTSLGEHYRQTKQNFERDMFPLWAGQGRLAAMVIPHASWVAVDDRKAYRLCCEAVAGE